MSSRVHPIFAELLRNIELQPVVLARAAAKAEPRRFSAEPHEPSAFAGLDGVGVVGSERHREVWEQEAADHFRDEREERIERGE